MPRTSEDAVIDILGADYGKKPDGTLPSLKGYMDSAYIVVSNVKSLASDQKGITLSTAELELMERWLAAHFYTKSDPTYSSRSTAGASGSFIRNSETPEPYKDGAMSIDRSGMLNALLNNKRASVMWLGKVEDEMIDAQDRTG